MNILAVIPMRGGSKGLPRKNLLTLAGRPILSYTLEYLKRSAHKIHTVVTTEDLEISMTAKRLGVDVVPRSPELQGDSAVATDAVRDAMFFLERTGYRADLIIELYACVPVRPERVLDEAITAMMCRPEISSVTTVYPEDERYHPNHACVMAEDGSLSFPYHGKPTSRQDLPKLHYHGCSFCVFRRQFLALEKVDTRTPFGPNWYGIEVPADSEVNIDSMEDFQRAENHFYSKQASFGPFRKYGKPGKPGPCTAVGSGPMGANPQHNSRD